MVGNQLEKHGCLTHDFETGHDGTSSMPGTPIRETMASTHLDSLGTSDKRDCKMADQARYASAGTDTIHGCPSSRWFFGEDGLPCR